MDTNANVELVHPLPAAAEDELGVEVHITMGVANTAAGSGLHEATCSASSIYIGLSSGVASKLQILQAGLLNSDASLRHRPQ
jgi:hypothetical protein